jgi:F-type H+-transporting ATPase subunit epsilon
MKTLQISVVSSEAEIFTGEASGVVLPGRMGELGIKPGHTPLLTILRPGSMHIVEINGLEQVLYVSGGYAEIQPHLITVLADTVVRASNLDFKRAQLARENAQKIIAHGAIGIDFAKAKLELSRACAQLRTIEKLRKRKT